MHLRGPQMKPLSRILSICDVRGWTCTITQGSDYEIFVYTPWQSWLISQGGSVSEQHHD